MVVVKMFFGRHPPFSSNRTTALNANTNEHEEAATAVLLDRSTATLASSPILESTILAHQSQFDARSFLDKVTVTGHGFQVLHKVKGIHQGHAIFHGHERSGREQECDQVAATLRKARHENYTNQLSQTLPPQTTKPTRRSKWLPCDRSGARRSIK